MGWLISAVALTFLCLLPLGLCAAYDMRGASVWLRIGPVRIRLYPKTKEQKKHKRKNDKNAPSDDSFASSHRMLEKNGGKLTDFIPLVQTVLELLDSIRKKIYVNNLSFKLILAGDDPCELAIHYGRAWAALGNLMPQLERFLLIKKRDMEVECDFTSTQTVVFARLDATITLGRALWLAVFYGIKVLKQYFKVLNQRKGGAGI